MSVTTLTDVHTKSAIMPTLECAQMHEIMLICVHTSAITLTLAHTHCSNQPTRVLNMSSTYKFDHAHSRMYI